MLQPNKSPPKTTNNSSDFQKILLKILKNYKP